MIAYAASTDAQLELVDETHVVFIVSTTGQGDFPVSARPFWRFLLREGLPGDILGDLHFATLGLGDSTYTRFCWAARMLTQRLKQLGAVPWMEDGEADERDPLGCVLVSDADSRAAQRPGLPCWASTWRPT